MFFRSDAGDEFPVPIDESVPVSAAKKPKDDKEDDEDDEEEDEDLDDEEETDDDADDADDEDEEDVDAAGGGSELPEASHKAPKTAVKGAPRVSKTKAGKNSGKPLNASERQIYDQMLKERESLLASERKNKAGAFYERFKDRLTPAAKADVLELHQGIAKLEDRAVAEALMTSLKNMVKKMPKHAFTDERVSALEANGKDLIVMSSKPQGRKSQADQLFEDLLDSGPDGVKAIEKRPGGKEWLAKRNGSTVKGGFVDVLTSNN